MGCCTSKPENSSMENHFHSVHNNKLVISPTTSSSSSSSTCSFTCTNKSNSIIASTSSSLSSDSSSLLWSCYKENNPHYTQINNSSLNHATHSLVPSKPSFTSIMRQSLPQKKRVRSNSPVNLTRQKSFRKEVADHHRHKHNNSSHNVLPSGMLRSPSPSRRLNGTSNSVPNQMKNSSKNKATHSHCVSSSTRKVIIKPTSPNNSSSSSSLVHSGLRHREKCSYRNNVPNMIDETMVDVDSGLVEDIDNPLVSFDCFIFL